MRETKYNQNPQPRKAPIDHEALWGKISSDRTFPAVDNSPRKRLWILGGIGFILMVGVIIFFWSKPGLNKNANALGAHPIIQQKSEANADHQLELNLPTDKPSNTNTDNSKRQSFIVGQIDTPQPDLPTKILDQIESKPSINYHTVANSQNQTKVNIDDSQSRLTLLIPSSQPLNATGYDNTQSTVNSTLSPNPTEQSEALATTKSQLDSEGLQSQQDFITPFDKLTANVLLARTNDIAIADDNLIDVKSSKGLLAYANISYGLSMHSVNTTTDLVNDKVLIEDFLQNNESKAIEIGIKKRILKRYRIGLGAELRQDWQKYRREVRDTSIVSGDEFSRLLATRTDYTLHQKYQTANLLLSVDRVIPLKNVLLEIGGGLSYMLSMTSSGRVLDTQLRLIERPDAFPLRASGTFGGFGQAGITYPLSENWRASLNVRYNISSQLSANEELYQHKLSALRLGASIGYEF